MTTISDVHSKVASRVLPALCVLLAALAAPLAIINAIAGVASSAVALVWSVAGVRTRRPAGIYGIALWVAVVALLINIAVVFLSITFHVETSTTIVVPVSQH